MNPNKAGSRIAVLADLHGNTLALDAVLADIQSGGGVDEFWFLGDYAAIGYDPIGVLERISHIPNATFVRGNTDRYLAEVSQPWPNLADAQANPELNDLFVRVGRSFAWTTGAVGATGWLPWLSELPLEHRAALADGTRVLAVHAAPGEDDGFGIHPNTDEADLKAMIGSTDADLLLVGHTHMPFDRKTGSVRVVNPGSVSNPLPPDLRACYAILLVERAGYEVEFHRVEFDLEAVIERTRSVNHPASDYITSFMRGERRPDWMKDEG